MLLKYLYRQKKRWWNEYNGFFFFVAVFPFLFAENLWILKAFVWFYFVKMWIAWIKFELRFNVARLSFLTLSIVIGIFSSIRLAVAFFSTISLKVFTSKHLEWFKLIIFESVPQLQHQKFCSLYDKYGARDALNLNQTCLYDVFYNGRLFVSSGFNLSLFTSFAISERWT